ncbi:hypothetical protein M0811_12223 [Anaeramoeba ignava]|uniref:Vacuolar protein sorting 55 n=1 Tax=Anaeramoeba ignava TaxID=1746090 RepID=A0A9Q0R675_ANAIG|nr:hypothetical protein M0811_12223 [Anaeramoeba ignava]
MALGTQKLGILLNIVACAVYHEWILLVVILFYFFTALPNILCGSTSEDFLADSPSNLELIANFFTGILSVSGFALPLVLAHTGAVKIEAAILSLCGGIVVAVTVIFALKRIVGKKPDF